MGVLQAILLAQVTAHTGFTCDQTWKKTFFFTQARFDPKLFYLKKCLNFDKSEFATKQR